MGQEEAIARPEVKAGDRWIYRRMNYAAKAGRGDYELRVTFAGPKAIIAVVTGRGGKPDIDTTWTADWNSVVATNGDTYAPDTATFRFPLRVGEAWPSVFELTRPNAYGFKMRFERTARATGWEDVQVPAGPFRALRVEIDGPWKRLDVNASGRARSTLWYAPQVKRWVKYVYEDAASGAHFGEELVRFIPST